MSTNDLVPGDVVYFHNWCIGGFLFGVIVPYEDNFYHNKLNIWRPKSIYYLQDCECDGARVIHSLEDVCEYDLQEFKEFLEAARSNGVYCNF